MPRKHDETGAAGIDRRHETRHAVERPCRVAPESSHADRLKGTTANVSRSGVLVRFPECFMLGELPRVGEQARVVIDLPPSADYSPRTLECSARVVRSEEALGDAPALAFEVQRMQIRERDEQAEGDSGGSSRMVQ